MERELLKQSGRWHRTGLQNAGYFHKPLEVLPKCVNSVTSDRSAGRDFFFFLNKRSTKALRYNFSEAAHGSKETLTYLLLERRALPSPAECKQIPPLSR